MKKKKEVAAKIIFWDAAKSKKPKGEIVRIFPRYMAVSKKKQLAVLIKLIGWINSELRRLC